MLDKRCIQELKEIIEARIEQKKRRVTACPEIKRLIKYLDQGYPLTYITKLFVGNEKEAIRLYVDIKNKTGYAITQYIDRRRRQIIEEIYEVLKELDDEYIARLIDKINVQHYAMHLVYPEPYNYSNITGDKWQQVLKIYKYIHKNRNKDALLKKLARTEGKYTTLYHCFVYSLFCRSRHNMCIQYCKEKYGEECPVDSFTKERLLKQIIFAKTQQQIINDIVLLLEKLASYLGTDKLSNNEKKIIKKLLEIKYLPDRLLKHYYYFMLLHQLAFRINENWINETTYLRKLSQDYCKVFKF